MVRLPVGGGRVSDCDTIFYFVTYYVFLLLSRDDLDIETVMRCLGDVRDDMSENKIYYETVVLLDPTPISPEIFTKIRPLYIAQIGVEHCECRYDGSVPLLHAAPSSEHIVKPTYDLLTCCVSVTTRVLRTANSFAL